MRASRLGEPLREPTGGAVDRSGRLLVESPVSRTGQAVIRKLGSRCCVVPTPEGTPWFAVAGPAIQA